MVLYRKAGGHYGFTASISEDDQRLVVGNPLQRNYYYDDHEDYEDYKDYEDYNDYEEYDYDDDYDDYDVLNSTQLLMQNSHSLLLSSFKYDP